MIRAVSGGREGVATSITVDHDQIQVIVGPGPKGSSADIVLLGYLRQATTHIGRGENSGRTLTESNIVRSMQLLGPWAGATGRFHADVASLPADITDIAVLVQSSDQGAIIGAAAHPIR